MKVWQPTDAAQATTAQALQDFLDLLELHGAKGYLGETGIPNNADVGHWAALLSGMYNECYANDIWVTQYGCGRSLANYQIAPFRGPGTPTPPWALNQVLGAAIPLIQQLPNPNFGVALTGLDHGDKGTPGGLPFSAANPGRLHYDYFEEPLESWAFLKKWGIKLAYMGMRWERMQPKLGGVLDPTYMQLIDKQIYAAASNGIKVILHMAGEGRYKKDTADALQGGLYLGTPQLPWLYLANVFQRISDKYKNTGAVVAYSLMNEPHDLPGGTEDLVEGINLVISGIRAKGDRKLLMAPLDGWSNPRGCVDLHENYPYIDPINNLRYEAHIYPDVGMDSTFSETYAEAVADGIANGFG